MSLTQCPECNGKISDKASACPHCGCPLTVAIAELETATKYQAPLQEDPRNSSWKSKIGFAAACVIAFILFKVAFNVGNTVASSRDKGTSIEEVARAIAEQAARMHEATRDDAPELLDAKFYAKGKTVYMEYIRNTRPNLSPQDISEFDAEVKSFVIPQSCEANKNNPAFPLGLQYVMTYKNQYGQKLSEFVIDKVSCSRKLP